MRRLGSSVGDEVRRRRGRVGEDSAGGWGGSVSRAREVDEAG
jgi:hypothetical protein